MRMIRCGCTRIHLSRNIDHCLGSIRLKFQGGGGVTTPAEALVRSRLCRLRATSQSRVDRLATREATSIFARRSPWGTRPECWLSWTMGGQGKRSKSPKGKRHRRSDDESVRMVSPDLQVSPGCKDDLDNNEPPSLRHRFGFEIRLA